MVFSDIRRLMEEEKANAEFARQSFPYTGEVAIQNEYGDLVPTDELVDEFLRKEYVNANTGTYREGGFGDLEEAREYLLDEYQAAMEELFGDPPWDSAETNMVNRLVGEFTGDPQAMPFVPLWDPVDRQRLETAFRDGGIDAVNQYFPEYDGLELPETEGRWDKDRDMMEQLIPANQMKVMGLNNRLRYLNLLENAMMDDTNVDNISVMQYRNPQSPFLRSGVNRMGLDHREGMAQETVGMPNYIMAQEAPDAARIMSSTTAPTTTALQSMFQLIPDFHRYNLIDRGGDSESAMDNFAGMVDRNLARSLSNQNAKQNYSFMETMPTTQVQSGQQNYANSYESFRKFYDRQMKSLPPENMQMTDAAMESMSTARPFGMPLGEKVFGANADERKEFLHGPYGPLAANTLGFATELGDPIYPWGAMGESAVGAFRAFQQPVKAASKMGALIQKARNASLAAGAEFAVEGSTDLAFNTMSDAMMGGNLAPEGYKPEIRNNFAVDKEITRNQAALKEAVPMPRESMLNPFQNRPNYVQRVIDRRGEATSPEVVQSLMSQDQNKGYGFKADIMREAEEMYQAEQRKRATPRKDVFGGAGLNTFSTQ